MTLLVSLLVNHEEDSSKFASRTDQEAAFVVRYCETADSADLQQLPVLCLCLSALQVAWTRLPGPSADCPWDPQSRGIHKEGT